MGYRVLQFEPKHISQNTEVILWKAQLDPPPNFNSIATVLISDNIAVNNRRPVDESSGFQSVNCTKCSNTMEITSEEYAFKSRDNESSGFICVPCMKKAVRR